MIRTFRQELESKFVHFLNKSAIVHNWNADVVKYGISYEQSEQRPGKLLSRFVRSSNQSEIVHSCIRSGQRWNKKVKRIS